MIRSQWPLNNESESLVRYGSKSETGPKILRKFGDHSQLLKEAEQVCLCPLLDYLPIDESLDENSGIVGFLPRWWKSERVSQMRSLKAIAYNDLIIMRNHIINRIM